MDDYFYNLVVGKVSLSRNHEGKDKENETTYHILSLFFILVRGKPSKLVVETMFWGNICIACDRSLCLSYLTIKIGISGLTL